MLAGTLAIISAVGLNLYNVWDDGRAASVAAQTLDTLVARIDERKQSPRFSPPVSTPAEPNGSPAEGPEDYAGEAGEMEALVIDGVEYIGVLSIPVLNLSLPVDMTWSYPKLKNSPCRYSGNLYENTLVIAAHNYKTHFGNVSLLAEGDAVVFTDAFGAEHNFSVASIINVGPMDVGDVVDNGYDLTLFTCTYSGQARVVVRCVRD